MRSVFCCGITRIRLLSGFLALALLSLLALGSPAQAQTCTAAMAPCDYKLPVGDRYALVHVPVAYFQHQDAHETVALLLDIHGYNRDGRLQAEHQRSISGQKEESDRRGFIAVWPQSTFSGNTESWNGLTCCSPAYPTVDDTGFLSGIISQLEATYAIDTARIYVTGESNGGAMTARMGCEVPAITAIAPVSAAIYGDVSAEEEACAPTTPIPVIEFRGLKDPLVKYDGSNRFQSATVALQRWLHVNGCTNPDNAADLPHQPVGTGDAYEQTGIGCGAQASLVTLPESQHVPYKKNSGVDIAGYMWTTIFVQAAPAG